MEKPHKHHEILRPIREIVRNVGEFVVDKVIPTDVIDNLFSPPEARGAEAMLRRELDRERELTQQALAEQDRSNVAPWVYRRLGE
jgi:hypothetical protein